jgi:DNA-binding transcriptional LysR family regulator
MELRHVRYFVAAAEEGHIGRAAHRLRISPQGLGIQIRELERELGVDLFERLARGVRLTPAGTTLFGHARRLLADLQAAVEDVQETGRGEVGLLRFGHVPMVNPSQPDIGELIVAFCARYPRVEIRSHDLSTADQYAALDEGRIDVAIVHGPPEAAAHYHCEPIEDWCVDGVLLPAAHPLARRDTIALRDLAGLPCLKAPSVTNPGAHEFFIHEFQARGLDVRFDTELEISDAAVRHSLVAAGAGWSGANSATAASLVARTPGIAFRKFSDPPIPFPRLLVWRKAERSRLVLSFVAFVREFVRDAASSPVADLRGERVVERAG